MWKVLRQFSSRVTHRLAINVLGLEVVHAVGSSHREGARRRADSEAGSGSAGSPGGDALEGLREGEGCRIQRSVIRQHESRCSPGAIPGRRSRRRAIRHAEAMVRMATQLQHGGLNESTNDNEKRRTTPAPAQQRISTRGRKRAPPRAGGPAGPRPALRRRKPPGRRPASLQMAGWRGEQASRRGCSPRVAVGSLQQRVHRAIAARRVLQVLGLIA